jgi:hypothetical protein
METPRRYVAELLDEHTKREMTGRKRCEHRLIYCPY